MNGRRVLTVSLAVCALTFCQCHQADDSSSQKLRKELQGVWWFDTNDFHAAYWIKGDSINYVEEGWYPYSVRNDSFFVFSSDPPDTEAFMITFRGRDTLILTQPELTVNLFRGKD
jgi:hypothetical protein